MRYLIFVAFFMFQPAFAIVEGEWTPDWKMCDEMAMEIESVYAYLDPKVRAEAEGICFLRDELEDRKFPLSKLSRREQKSTKGIINSLCIDFELASCVDYSSY